VILRPPPPATAASAISFSSATVTITLPWQRPAHWFLGFGFERIDQKTPPLLVATARQTTTRVVTPLWFITSALAVLPLVRLRAAVRTRRRRQAQQCVACGYDLRATPDRCPECGAVTKMSGALRP
jgi:hypothetical protein